MQLQSVDPSGMRVERGQRGLGASARRARRSGRKSGDAFVEVEVRDVWHVSFELAIQHLQALTIQQELSGAPSRPQPVRSRVDTSGSHGMQGRLPNS